MEKENSEKLESKIKDEMLHYENEIRKIDIEIARLQSKKECYSDAKAMLWGLIN